MAMYRCSECDELIDDDYHPMNEDALKIVLEISAQLNATPVDSVQIMRKTVIDGSNTSGFQRTAIIAYNGHGDTAKGRVNIPTIALEEESAGIVKSSNSHATYRLDRLGIPLIEARDAGLAIIASELDYVRDIVDPEVTFDPASPLSIARAVKRFLGEKEETLHLLSAKGFLDAVFRS